VSKLAELRLIRIERSLDATPRERDRRYFLDDPFLAFWYRFCLPNLSPLAAGHAGEVWSHAIAPRLDDWMGGLFEWICRDYVRNYATEVLPSAAQEVGRVWSANYDIDVAGTLLDGAVVTGECKWWKEPVGLNVLERLEERASLTAYRRPGRERFHVIFSRSGFTRELEQRQRSDPSVRLVGVRELLGSVSDTHRE
jgi:uncharacterized protein